MPFHNNLSAVYSRVGRYEDSIREARTALALNPRAALVYGNLAYSLRAVGRFDDVKEVAAEARHAGVDAFLLHTALYLSAVARGDDAGRDEQVAWARNRPDGSMVRNGEFLRAIMEGRFADAERALDSTVVGSASNAAQYFALSGDCARAAKMTAIAVRSLDPYTAIGPALCGDVAQARALLPRIEAMEGSDTNVHLIGVPMTRAALAFHDHDWEGARRELRAPLQLELGTQTEYDATYLAGLIALGDGDAASAATSFQKIIDHPGVSPVTAPATLAWLGLARAAAMAHDVPRSRKAYETFFQRWSHADPGLRLLADARAEYARLK
jgi:tetratricopeptide (TPR) repeat protein